MMRTRLMLPRPAGRLLLRVGNLGARRFQSSGARTDGFNDALPRRDVVFPIVTCSVLGFGLYYLAEEGKVKALVDGIEMNTDPNAWPTPKQFFSVTWPWVAGTVMMLFDSVACKFASTSDFKYLCTSALNDDLKATVSLCILAAPAEHSAPFVKAISETGALARINEIVHIYKSLPRDQHDETLTNACVIAAKAAADPSLRAQALPLQDFLWMMPSGSPQLYTAYGAEGVAHLWMDSSEALLAGNGVGLAAEHAAGSLAPSNYFNFVTTELASRLLNRFNEQKDLLLSTADSLEKRIELDILAAGKGSGRKTIWQATGVHRGETELEIARREKREQLLSVRRAREVLTSGKAASTPTPVDEMLGLQGTLLERFAPLMHVTSAGSLAYGLGALRGYLNGWWADVTPSVCRELAGVVGKRSAIGAALLVVALEAMPRVKKQALDALGRKDITSYAQDGALEQLLAIDAAYIALLAGLNFFFPYILVPVAFNPTQMLVPPNSHEFPRASSKPSA